MVETYLFRIMFDVMWWYVCVGIKTFYYYQIDTLIQLKLFNLFYCQLLYDSNQTIFFGQIEIWRILNKIYFSNSTCTTFSPPNSWFSLFFFRDFLYLPNKFLLKISWAAPKNKIKNQSKFFNFDLFLYRFTAYYCTIWYK